MNAELERIPAVTEGNTDRGVRPAETRGTARDLRIIQPGPGRERNSSPGLWNRWRPQPRQALLLVVVALHAAIFALLLMPHTRDRLPIALPAIEAQILTDAPVHPPTPPLPPLDLQRPHIDLITPDVAITEPAPDAPTASPPTPAAAAAPAKTAPGPAAPVTPPRFDAAYLNNPAPTYPMASRRLHEQGTVLMRVRVSPQGAAQEELQQSSATLDAHPSAAGEGNLLRLQDRTVSRLERIEAAIGRRMRRGTGVLATIGATAPFVGLFGTVWGIMNSFIGISKSQTTNLAVVAPGIAEALLATAFGLVAAIPAVVIYNHFARQTATYRALVADTSAAVLRLVSRDLSAGVRPEPRLHAVAE